MITVQTDMGKITFPKGVIGNIVMDVVDSFDGKVILSNSKGRIHKLAYKLGTKEEANNIEVEINGDGIDVRIYVILRFGISIKNITHNLIDEIRSEIKQASGLTAENISIVVTGMMSKKVAPRNIEVTG